jgi:hypothetical protein
MANEFNPESAAIFTRLDASKRKALKRLAVERDTTVAELVRQAIDHFLKEEKQ